MSREQDRIKKKLEKNLIIECNKIQQKFYPELFKRFTEVNDPRHQSYIEYSIQTMLGTLYYKCICGISSMQEMTRTFNDELVVKNLYAFVGEKIQDYLPHGVTINELLEKLDPEELENIQKGIAYSMIRRKTRLPIVITAYGLYVTQRVLQICKEYQWDYIIRYKEGCASSIAKEYRALPEVEKSGTDIEFQNDIMFQDFDVNLVYYKDKRKSDGEERITEFAWITSIRITKTNAKKIVRAGRNRWKIENQGFHRQKHWQGNIEHACSWNERAQKNHYLMEQIADFMKQLYEYFFLEKNEIKKLQKNISSELLASFARPLTETEDINTELQKAILN